VQNEPKLLRWLGAAIDWAVAGAGALVIALVFYNVLSRYILHTDVAWSSELSTLLLIWISFIGGAMAVRRNAHLGVTEFIMGLKPAARSRIDAAVLALTALALGLLVYFGITLTAMSWDNIAIAIRISNGWWYLAMPVGCGLMLVFVLHQLLLVLRCRQPLNRLLGREEH
jgi:TRAP-type C4-dicarboxylate transport system permease small subunit